MDFLEGDRARLEPSGPSKRPPSPEEWYVTSQGNFWPSSRRERPGVQLPFQGEFDWAGFHWLVRECIPPPKRWLWISAAK